MATTPQVTEEPKAPVAQEQPSTTVSTTEAPKAEKPFFTVYDAKSEEYKALPQEDENPPEPPKEEVKAEAKPPEPKVYAGKFKSDVELEKSYIELEKTATQKMQEAAELRKQLEATKVKSEATVVASPVEKKIESAINETEFLDSLVADPKKAKESLKAEIMGELSQQINMANEARQLIADWEKENPDLATQQHVVNAEIQKILAADPNKAADRKQLLNEATGNLRSWLGTIRQAGAAESLVVRREVVPLAASGAATQGQPAATTAPVTKSEEDYFREELSSRKRDYQRTGGVLLPAK